MPCSKHLVAPQQQWVQQSSGNLLQAELAMQAGHLAVLVAAGALHALQRLGAGRVLGLPLTGCLHRVRQPRQGSCRILVQLHHLC